MFQIHFSQVCHFGGYSFTTYFELSGFHWRLWIHGRKLILLIRVFRFDCIQILFFQNAWRHWHLRGWGFTPIFFGGWTGLAKMRWFSTDWDVVIYCVVWGETRLRLRSRQGILSSLIALLNTNNFLNNTSFNHTFNFVLVNGAEVFNVLHIHFFERIELKIYNFVMLIEFVNSESAQGGCVIFVGSGFANREPIINEDALLRRTIIIRSSLDGSRCTINGLGVTIPTMSLASLFFLFFYFWGKSVSRIVQVLEALRVHLVAECQCGLNSLSPLFRGYLGAASDWAFRTLWLFVVVVRGVTSIPTLLHLIEPLILIVNNFFVDFFLLLQDNFLFFLLFL